MDYNNKSKIVILNHESTNPIRTIQKQLYLAMKALILLEQFILSRQATNAQHQEALKWLAEVQKYAQELEQKLEALNKLDNG